MAESTQQGCSLRRIQTPEDLLEEFNKLKDRSVFLKQDDFETKMEEFTERFRELEDRRYSAQNLLKEEPIMQKKTFNSSTISTTIPIQKAYKNKCRKGGSFGNPQTHDELLEELNKLKDSSVDLSQEELDEKMAEFAELSRELRELEFSGRVLHKDEKLHNPIAEPGYKTDADCNTESRCNSASDSFDLLGLGSDFSDSLSSDLDSEIKIAVLENEKASKNLVATSGPEAAYDSLYLWDSK
ncbi:hypothetical protein EYC80_003476 [Monilinia laxa]|uniref:Uncharacterized protein n=1 Tax=Monilinia laxa TaxID=61186 RepID=A0A5N6KE43_MONLA|nr:hypothetical protein EYC80_003476 [Monilinia laxa]